MQKDGDDRFTRHGSGRAANTPFAVSQPASCGCFDMPEIQQMIFSFEEIGREGPGDLMAEHQLLVAWLEQHPRAGHIEYLDHRLVDRVARIALYYIRGFGMGRGKTFALVQGEGVYIFDAIEERSRDSDGVVSSLRIPRISIPEDAKLHRNTLQSFITAALESYGKHHGFLWSGFLPGANNCSVSFEAARWIVRPKKFSRLYWGDKTKDWLNKYKSRALRLRRYLASPFFALVLFFVSLLLAASEIYLANLAVIFSGMWFAWQLVSYDEDYVLKYWFMGVQKLRHPFLALKSMERLMTPKPLPALIVKLEFSSLDCSTCVISIVNTTLFPVRYLSIGSRALADLFAPGFVKSLSLENQGKKSPKELEKKLEAVYPSLTKKWMLPKCSVNWRIPMLPEYPIHELGRDIEAIIGISRFVSGEPTSRVTSYLLPVTRVYARDA